MQFDEGGGHLSPPPPCSWNFQTPAESHNTPSCWKGFAPCSLKIKRSATLGTQRSCHEWIRQNTKVKNAIIYKKVFSHVWGVPLNTEEWDSMWRSSPSEKARKVMQELRDCGPRRSGMKPRREAKLQQLESKSTSCYGISCRLRGSPTFATAFLVT